METQITPSSSVPVENALDPRRWFMLVVVLCASFMGTLDEYIINVAIPSIQKELQSSFAEVQFVVAGYALAFAVLLVLGGRLGDLYGRKRVFLLGVGCFTLFSALCGFASTPILLVLFRIAQGVGAALMIPQVMSFIQVTFDARERPFAFGTYAAMSGLASVLGQVLGGFLLAANLFNLGWRIIFLINVPIGIIALALAFPLIRESRLEESDGLDYGGAALLALTLFLLVFPLVMGGEAGWPLWSVVCLILFVPALIAFLIYERRVMKRGRSPLVSLLLFQQRRFSAGLLTGLLAFSLYAGQLFLQAFYLQTILRLSPLQAGLAFMMSSITFILASSFSPFFSTRLKVWGMSVAAGLVTLAHLLTLLAAQWFVPLWGIVPMLIALFMIGTGMGLLCTPLMSKTLEEIRPDDVGTASGVYMTISQLSGALGIALLGLIFSIASVSNGSGHAFVVATLVTVVLSFIIWFTVLPLKGSR